MVTPNAYIRSVLRKYALPNDHRRQVNRVISDLRPQIRSWAGNRLLKIELSGSFAKGTVIRGGTDVDLFISLSRAGDQSLREIYESLYTALQLQQLRPRRQDVSIGLVVRGLKVDLVPARRHAGPSQDHSLYKQRTDTWIQTNVARHIRIVKNSGLQREIRALKIWRRLHGLEFPSILLELASIEAMRRKRRLGSAENLLRIWGWIEEHISDARIIDPANSANVISDDLTAAEKADIAVRARWTLRQGSWDKVLW